MFKRQVWLLLALAVACNSGGPSGPGNTGNGGGTVSGKTATFEGLSATLVSAEDNFVTPLLDPEPGFRFYTVQVSYKNGSNQQRSFNPFDFQIETNASNRIDPTAGWREPAIHAGNLAPGDVVAGWVTFQLPIGSQPVRLLYSPRFDVTLAIPF